MYVALGLAAAGGAYFYFKNPEDVQDLKAKAKREADQVKQKGRETVDTVKTRAEETLRQGEVEYDQVKVRVVFRLLGTMTSSYCRLRARQNWRMYDRLQSVRRINMKGKAGVLERISSRNTTPPKVPLGMASQKPVIRQRNSTMKPVQPQNGKRRRVERPRKPKQVGSVGCAGESNMHVFHKIRFHTVYYNLVRE